MKTELRFVLCECQAHSPTNTTSTTGHNDSVRETIDDKLLLRDTQTTVVPSIRIRRSRGPHRSSSPPSDEATVLLLPHDLEVKPSELFRPVITANGCRTEALDMTISLVSKVIHDPLLAREFPFAALAKVLPTVTARYLQ